MRHLLFFIITISILFGNDYESWLKSQENEYQQYKKSIDEEFANMLKKDWEAFQQKYKASAYDEPKPKEAPTVPKKLQSKQKPQVKNIKPISLKKKTPSQKPQSSEPRAPKKKKTPKLQEHLQKLTIDFFDTPIEIYHDPQIVHNVTVANKKSISTFWEQISSKKYKEFFEQLKIVSSKHNFNDWALYQFVYQYSTQVSKNTMSSTLLTWFILTQSGYDVKVGYTKNSIYLLGNIAHKLYQVSYFTLNNKRYYILSPKGKIKGVHSMHTYKSDHPKAQKKFDFTLTSPLEFDYQNIQKRVLRFTYNQKKYSINSYFTKSLTQFYNTFPQSDYQVYFNSFEPDYFTRKLLEQLSRIIQDKNEVDTINLLLRFTQKAFEYRTDNEQFSYEKVMMPQETLFYPYSDCEDRTIFFRYLISQLTNLKIVGIKYSDHIATAIALKSNIKGDKFHFKGNTYTVADPTYIGANLGMAMPQYKNSKFTIIP